MSYRRKVWIGKRAWKTGNMEEDKMTVFEKTFDDAAIDYDHSRPTYVKEIYEDIFRYKPAVHMVFQ